MDLFGYDEAGMPDASAFQTTDIGSQPCLPQFGQNIRQTPNQQQQRSQQQWEELRAPITRLYIDEGNTFQQVAQILARDYGFRPTKRQFTRRLTEWKLKKNVSRKRKRSEGADIETKDDPGFPALSEVQGTKRPAHVSSSETPKGGSTSRANSPEDDIVHEDQNECSPEGRDSWPFAEANIDVVGSPNLTRLFAALKLEIPDDCPELALPPAIFSHLEKKERQYISPSAIMRMDYGEHQEDEEVQEAETMELACWVQPARKLDTSCPWKPWGIDADMSTGIYYYSSPLNELWPFPRCYQSTNLRRGLTKTVFSSNQERYLESKASFNKLKLHLLHLPESHPVILGAIEDQADACFNLGRIQESVSLYRKLLSLIETSSGCESREYWRILYKLADSLWNEGRFKEAKQVHQKVHHSIIERLNPNDPLLLESLKIEAVIEDGLGNVEIAEALYRQLVQMQLLFRGPKHPESLLALRFLGSGMNGNAKFSRSEQLLYNVLQLYSSATSDSYSSGEGFFLAVDELCESLLEQEKFEESANLCKTCLEKAKSVLGSEHKDTMRLQWQFASALRKLGKLDESEVLFRQTLDQQVRVRGENDLYTIDSMMRLAELLTSLERHHEATELYERRFRANLEVGGPNDNFTFEAFRDLGRSYDAEKRFEDTEKLCEEYMGSLKAVGDDQGESYLAKSLSWMKSRFKYCFSAEGNAFGPHAEATFNAYCNLMQCCDELQQYEALNEVYEQYIGALRALDHGKEGIYVDQVENWTTELREKRFQTELENSGPDADSTYDAFKYLVWRYDAEGREEDSDKICDTYVDTLRALDGKGDEYIARVQRFMAPKDQSEQSEDGQLDSENEAGKGKEVQVIS